MELIKFTLNAVMDYQNNQRFWVDLAVYSSLNQPKNEWESVMQFYWL